MEKIDALREWLAKVEAGEALREGFSDYPLLYPDHAPIAAAYNGSLDAAKALHEAVLPAWDWQIEENIWGYAARIGAAREVFSPSIAAVSLESPAHAWLTAILKALIANEEATP